MDKLIHTALNSLNNARVRQNVSSQNLANAQVPGFRGDEIGGRFGSVFLESDETLSTRVFTKQSEPGLFLTCKESFDKLVNKPMLLLPVKGIFSLKAKMGS